MRNAGNIWENSFLTERAEGSFSKVMSIVEKIWRINWLVKTKKNKNTDNYDSEAYLYKYIAQNTAEKE